MKKMKMARIAATEKTVNQDNAQALEGTGIRPPILQGGKLGT